jgi:hypothetical protein
MSNEMALAERAEVLDRIAKPTFMDLLSLALHNNAAIDVVERLAALQEKQMAREAEIEFNEALHRVQEQIKRVAPDLYNEQTRSKWASYAAIDRKIRPIYSAEGFALSFSHGDSPKPDHIRVIGRLSLRGHKEFYQIDMPVDTKGPKGSDVMTLTHATGASDSYAKRYLVKDIFNIAIGDDDADGNINGELTEQIEWLQNARNQEELKKLFAGAYEKFETNPAALRALVAAKNEKKKEFS